jgi:hypothetical protein
MDKAMLAGSFSLLVAVASGFTTFYLARLNFQRDLKKMQAQIDAQQKIEEQERLASLRHRYLTPLRYYATTLSKRFGELEAKFQSTDVDRVRGWFKSVKDHVAGDQRRTDFGVWPYYEGIFSVSTLYYTCSYFQCAREIRYSQPFLRDSATYSEGLNKHLTRVSDSFVWDAGQQGIWDPLQEVIGERFTVDKSRLSYEGMCGDLDSSDPRRRGHYLRPLDFFWGQLTPEKSREIQGILDVLVAFLDSNSPTASRLPMEPARGQ